MTIAPRRNEMKKWFEKKNYADPTKKEGETNRDIFRH
jgi:hypothetical protein